MLSIWIFIAPWVLGFAMLSGAAWDHWVVGVLIFLFSISVLSRARHARMVSPPLPPTAHEPAAGSL